MSEKGNWPQFEGEGQCNQYILVSGPYFMSNTIVICNLPEGHAGNHRRDDREWSPQEADNVNGAWWERARRLWAEAEPDENEWGGY